MQSKKGAELIRAILKYVGEMNGFDRHMQKISIISGGEGKCHAEMKVEKEHLNSFGGLHGGFSSTIVDCMTTYALMTYKEDEMTAGVSVDLHVTFLKGAKENDELVIHANTIKCGRTLAYLDCEIRNKKCNSILVRGSHTKFVGSD